ncbi:hypothetical protein Emag_005459 [Eimeria magna]
MGLKLGVIQVLLLWTRTTIGATSEGIETRLGGVLVEDFPARACQLMLRNLEAAARLSPAVPLSQLLPVEGSSQEDVDKQLDVLLDLQRTDLNSSDKDLRFLLVKELRHILSCEKQPIKKLALFRKTEAAARLKLTTRFIQRLTTLGSYYERELLQQLQAGGKETRRTITKLFVTNTAEQVEEWLGAPTFFSPQLQTLLCLVMQVEPKDLTMQRETLEIMFNQYMLDPHVDRRHIIHGVFAHINSETLLFTDKEQNLILSFLELAWEMYYSHSIHILEALKMQDKTHSALDWLRGKLSDARDAIISLNGRQVLDRFGFLSASYLLRWVGSKSLPRLSLLLPNCRLAHVTGSTPVTFASTGDFAVAMEFTGLVGTVERVDERLFSLVINSFSALDFSALRRFSVSSAEPTFSGMISGMPTGNACLSVYDWLFTGGAPELRTLLNLELATIYMRMIRDKRLPVDQELQELFVHWFSSVELEKKAVLEELHHQMDEATQDPNFVIESFFFNPELGAKVITTPTYTTLGNAAAISAMAAVVQLKTLAWAVKLTPESLGKLQLLVVSNPSLRLTHHLAVEKGIVTPAGKQKVLRRDIVERLAVILEITARLHHRFFDNLAALLPPQLRDRLKNVLCGRRRSNTLTDSAGGATRGSLEELFDRTGFYSAFDLMVFAKSSGVTVNLIGENSRAITIGKADDKAMPITVVEGDKRREAGAPEWHDPRHLVRAPWSPSYKCGVISISKCMVMQLLRCKEYDVKCRSTLENAEKSNAELWEGVLLELNSPRTDGPQVFNRHPWNKLQRVLKDIFKANRPTLSFEEREVLLGGFLSEGLRQSPPSMHGIHLLRMRSILFKISPSDPGVACIISLLSGAEVMLSEACFEHLEKTFTPFLHTPATNAEEDLFLSRAAKRASAQLRSAQLVDSTTPETIAAELRRLYNMDFSTLYDFVISPLKDTSSSPDEKQALGACLYVLGRRIEHDDEIYSHAPGVVPRGGSPNLVKNCLLEVWHKHARRPSFATSNLARLGDTEQPASSWDAFVTGVQKRHLVSPAVEAFHRAAFSDVFLHILVHHRLLALMDALALFRKAISSKENPETGKEPSRLVASMRSLTSEELMQLMFASEKLIPFSLALVAQYTRKDIYSLYFLRTSGSAAFFRIGHQSRSRITNFLKKWHRRNLICTPSCVEVSPSLDMEALKKKTSFQSLESPEMQAENVSPGSIDICSQQMTAEGGSVLPVCHYESVPYRYAHEAFRLTLAQRAVPPRTWFQFFSMNHETVLKDCISEAKRFSKKQTLEDFARLTEWRRFLPVALSNAVKMLLAGFSARREAAVDVIDVVSLGELRNLPEDVILTSWRDYSLPLDSSDPAGMRYDKTRRFLTAIGAGFKCAQMFSSAQKVFFGAMKGNKEAEEFVQKLAAEYFLSAGSPQESFRAIKLEAKRSIAAFCRGRRNKCKVSPNTTPAPVPDTCSRPLVFCTKVLACANAKHSSKASSLNEDCLLNLVDELITSPSPLVSTEVVFKSLAPVLSKLSYSISVWNQLTGTLTRYTQTQNSLFENIPIQLIVAPRSELEGSVPSSESFTGPSASGAFSLHSLTPSTASSFVGLRSEEEEEEEEAYYSATASPEPPSAPAETEDTVVLLVSPGFDIYERLMEARRVADDGPSLTYTPHGGSFFQLERRLLEMQDKLSRLSPRHSMAAKSLGEMQSMIEELSTRDDFRGSDILNDSKLYAALGPNVDNQAFFSQQKHTIGESQNMRCWRSCKAFGKLISGTPSNTRLGGQASTVDVSHFRVSSPCEVACADTLLAEAAEPPSKLDWFLQKSLTGFQLFAACKDIPEESNAFRVEFLNRVKELLLTTKAEGEAMLRIGQQQRSHLMSMDKIQEAISQIDATVTKTPPCLTDGCAEDTEALPKLLKPVRRLLGAPRFRELMKEVMEKPAKDMETTVAFEAFRLSTPSAANEIALEAQERQHKQDEAKERFTVKALLHVLVSSDACSYTSIRRLLPKFILTRIRLCHLLSGKLLQAIDAKKLKLDTLTSINTNKLSRKRLTYQEWLQYSGQLHVVSRAPTISQALRSTGVARQHEAQVWTAIAEMLYRAPDTPWKAVQKKLKEQTTTEKALSNLGLQAVKKLYFAVRTLHQAVGLVDEADFKRFGAYAITNLLVDHLKDKGVYVAGNSAVTLRTIRQAKTFQEWLQDIVLLKVSKELVKPPVPAILVSEVQRKRLGAFLFRRLARSQLVSNIVRSLVNKTVGLVTPYVIRRSMSTLKSSEPAKAGAVGPALLSLAVVANCYLNMDFVVLTSVLPLVLGVMESHNTRSIVESILVKADIPRILGRTVLNFSAEIEDTIIDVVTSNYLEPGALNDVVLRATGVNLQLQDLNLASSFSKVAAYLQEIIRREAPVVLRDLREVVIEPTVHGMISYVEDLTNTFLSVGAKEIPQRILSRPSILSADLKNYYLGSSRVMDSEGQRFVYEAFLVAFSDQTLKALNPPLVPKGINGFSPVQKIILNTFLAPFEGIVAIADFHLWEREWLLETKEYRMVYYRPLQAATYGFLGTLQLKVKIRGANVTLKFFVESVEEESPLARKLLKKTLRRKPLVFGYTAYADGTGGTLQISTQQHQLVAKLVTRQKPAMTQSLRQVEIIHQATSPLLKYSHQNYQAIQGSLDNLDFVLKGMKDVMELNKCWETFRSNSLFSLLLDFEYYNQVSWFATEFHLAFTPQSRISGLAKIMVVPTEGRVYRTFTFDHYACQKMIAGIPAGLYVPCGTSPSRLRRAFGAAATWLTGMAYGKEPKCFRKVQYRRDAGGEMLDISWIEDGELQNIKLPVRALGRPGADIAQRDRAEAMLDRQTIRVVERVLNAEAAEAGSVAFPALRWLISTHIAGRSVLSGALRRERMLFETASLEQGEVQKLASKEQYSLEMHFFRRARTRTDPAWRLRVAALLNQAKYNELHEALGSRREEFVEALAKAYTTWIDRLQAEATEATASVVSAKQLEAMCPDKSRLEDCERNYGVWGSLYFQESDWTLAKSIGTKRMESPYLFKYWKMNQEASTANLAIADFEALERYKHSMRRTHNVEVVGGLQASISILLGKYTQALRAEEAGMDIRNDHKLQLLKYLHMQMRETLEEAKNPKEPNTTAILSSNLRAAGYDVLVRIPLHLRYTATEARERFGILEGLADMFYRDLQLPTRSIHLRSLYGLQINLYGSKVHLPFASRMMRSNPLASHAGFQLTRKNESIRDICTPNFCPHTAVMWNHVYVTLLVLMQLAESPDIVAELLAADAFTDITGFGLNEIPVTFEESFIAFKVDVLTSLEALPSFAPSTTLGVRGGRGFWMPQCVTDPLQAQLASLFEPLPGQLAKLPAVLRAVDSALHELRPKIRKNGYISYTDPEILALWWQVMAIAFKNNPGMELEIEAFSRAPQKTQKFCEIIQQAATVAGFVSQLKMADTKAVLVRRARRFGFESWTTLVESFYTAKPPPQKVRQSLERIFHVACRMIPASSETQSIKILGKETEDVDLFRTLVDAVTLRLMQLGQDVPPTMTHYPICRAIELVSCENFDLSDSTLSKSCQELEVVKQRILSKIDFSSKFCEAMQKAEEPLMERIECGENERNHALLKEFFLEYMTEQLETSAIKSQWSKIQEAQMLKYRNTDLFPVAENALASMIHEAGIRLAEVPSSSPDFPEQVRQAARQVYSTMCSFVDYASASLALKDTNVCRLMEQPPAPLIQTLSDMLEAHMRRIQLGRFSSTVRPLPTLTLQQIVNSDRLPKHPAGALTVGVLRFLDSYFTKGKTPEQSTEGGSAYQRVRRGLGNTINLILDRLYKLKSRFAEWNQKVIRSLRLLINYIVRLVLRSAKQMTYFGRKTLAMQQVEEKTQASMRRRLQQQEQKAGEQDSVSSDTSTTASEENASFVDVEGGSEIRAAFPEDTSPLLAASSSKDISLVQTGMLTRPEPKQGQGLLGIVRLLASMLLSDLPRSISDIVVHILPSVWNSISGVLRVKKSVVGSVKDTAEKVCVRVLDSTVLPGLISTNSLVPASLIKTQMSLLARNIHFSVMPEASTVERDLKAARRKSGFLGMLVLIRGLVFVVAGQLEDLLQNREFQDRIVKIIHRRVRELAGVIQAAFKRYLVSEVVCESVEVVIDVIADVLSEKRDDFVLSVLEVIELDTLGRLSVFIESHVWRLIKLLLDGGGALDLMKGIIGQVGFLGAAKDTVRAAWGWFFGGPRAQSRSAHSSE